MMDRRAFIGIFACSAILFSTIFLGVVRSKVTTIGYAAKTGSLIKIFTTNYSQRPLIIRVLIIRHSDEQMAIGDANLVHRAVQRAAAKGLKIQIIGDHLATSLEQFRGIVESKMTVNAVPADTLIIHTIGHGFGGGGLDNLGQRRNVMEIMVNAAQRNNQETLWWQLSCHAAAELPSINSDQDLFSNLASSSANQLSAAGVQGPIMEKVFIAMAEGDPRIDPNGDGTITAEELKNFLNGLDGRRRGDLLFARSPGEPIFGIFGPWMLPIIDRNNPQQQYPPSYIPVPEWRH